MKPVSDARRRRDADLPDAAQTVTQRSGGLCELRTPACTGTATQIHHLRGRVPIDGRSPNDPDLLAHTCADCHLHVEEVDRATAYERGWLLSRLGPVRRSALLPQEDPT